VRCGSQRTVSGGSKSHHHAPCNAGSITERCNSTGNIDTRDIGKNTIISRGLPERKVAYFGSSVILAFIIAGSVLIIANPQTHVTSTSIPPLTTDKILLPDGVSICSGDCGHTSPYLLATVLANSSSPLVTFELFVNGTDEGVTLEQTAPAGSNNSVGLENFPFQFQAYPDNTAMPIQAGRTYSVELVATFGDGETSTATVLTNATPTLATTTSSNQVITSSGS
jgi:hypothetical protein